MYSRHDVENQSDSLIDLLTGQCADLEKLLLLARQETIAAENGNFDELLNIVSERAKLGDKLVVFQQQIADLRMQLGESAESILRSPLKIQVEQLITQVLMQDSQTRPWLVAARQETSDSMVKLDQSKRGTTAYLRETSKGLAYDQQI